MSDTSRDENILPQTTFTWKYPMVNFSQTTVEHFNKASGSCQHIGYTGPNTPEHFEPALMNTHDYD